MALHKKFTAEFPNYLRNIRLCSTQLFGEIIQKKQEETQINKLIEKISFTSPSDQKSNKQLKIVSFNIMKLLNEEKILNCLSNYIQEGFSVFLLQEVVIRDWSNVVQEFLSKQWYNTYFVPTNVTEKKSKLRNYEYIGSMIASVFPLEHYEPFFYDLVRPQSKYITKNTFGVIYASVQYQWQKIWLYSNHMERFTRPKGRLLQLQQFYEWSSQHPHDLSIIAGDFNTWIPIRYESAIHYLIKNWFNYYTNSLPFMSLDHILIKWNAVSNPIPLTSNWSDHTAIGCHIEIQKPPPTEL